MNEVRPLWINNTFSVTFGGNDLDGGYEVQQTSDGGYVVVGVTWSYGAGEADLWLIKIDSLGNEQWNKTFGGSNSDGGYSIQQTLDNGFIIAGSTSSLGDLTYGEKDIWLIKTDNFGTLQWNKTFRIKKYNQAWSLKQTLDNGFIITGYTESPPLGTGDIFLIKTDNFGNIEWKKNFGGKNKDI